MTVWRELYFRSSCQLPRFNELKTGKLATALPGYLCSRPQRLRHLNLFGLQLIENEQLLSALRQQLGNHRIVFLELLLDGWVLFLNHCAFDSDLRHRSWFGPHYLNLRVVGDFRHFARRFEGKESARSQGPC